MRTSAVRLNRTRKILFEPEGDFLRLLMIEFDQEENIVLRRLQIEQASCDQW